VLKFVQIVYVKIQNKYVQIQDSNLRIRYQNLYNSFIKIHAYNMAIMLCS